MDWGPKGQEALPREARMSPLYSLFESQDRVGTTENGCLSQATMRLHAQNSSGSQAEHDFVPRQSRGHLDALLDAVLGPCLKTWGNVDSPLRATVSSLFLPLAQGEPCIILTHYARNPDQQVWYLGHRQARKGNTTSRLRGKGFLGIYAGGGHDFTVLWERLLLPWKDRWFFLLWRFLNDFCRFFFISKCSWEASLADWRLNRGQREAVEGCWPGSHVDVF